MEQYIKKSALIAEIERLFEKVGNSLGEYRNGAEHTLISIKDFIDTLEVKEVDLDEETLHSELRKIYTSIYDSKDIKSARHFFELGLKAQKGE